MKVKIEIICECGNGTSVDVKVDEFNETSITKEIRNSGDDFGAIQYHPDEISITCGKCNSKFELGT